MDINAVLKEYDAMFGVKTPRDILGFLEEKLVEAQKADDTGAQVILLNEIIGFCRDASLIEEGVGYAGVLEDLIERTYDRDRREYATTMLNLGNAYRGYGLKDLSASRYDACEECFGRILPEEDFLYAGLFNNRGLLYQETGEWEKAIAEFKRALKIAEIHREKEIERATTCANLATSMLNASPEYREEAKILLEEASRIFEKDGGGDFHYSAALSALGTMRYEEGEYAAAAEDFKRAMEILYAGTGESDAYFRVKANYELAARKAGIIPEVSDDALKSSGQMQMVSAGEQLVSAQEDERDAGGELSSGDRKNNDRSGNGVVTEKIVNNGKKDQIRKSDSAEKAREFYETALLPAIQAEFPVALDIIAIGYSGEGSEHFGYDDLLSTDHDYVRGCTIWVQELHAPVCAAALQELFIKSYVSYFKEEPDLRMGRQGVRLIDDYFEHITGLGGITMLQATGGLAGRLYFLSEEQLDGIATAVNGELFHDGDGTMTKLRDFFLTKMPEEYRRRKLATLTHQFSQAGQYDYGRCLKRGDKVTAQMYKARAMETALRITSYLNRRFPPYLKWLKRFVGDLRILPEISDLYNAIADMDPQPERFAQGGVDDIALTFDMIAILFLDEMRLQGLIDDYSKEDPFMDRYIGEIAGLSLQLDEWTNVSREEVEKTQSVAGQSSDGTKTKEELIELIVAEEWMQFDKTINEGGRADCQDNWETFSVMRRSQYMTWDEDMLRSFYNDLTTAHRQGRNLITEKYGRMMESTAPDRYAELAPYFVQHNEDRIRIQEEIIGVQVGWMEEFASKYPLLAGNARSIHTSEDTADNTSYETYLRGELGTYSDETLILYGRFIARLAQQGKNLAYETMNNTAQLLGYKDADDAESRMKGAT